MRTFDIVLLDPPWDYYGSKDGMGDAAKFYKLMSDREIIKFHPEKYLAPKGVMFLWATSPRLDLAIKCIRYWQLFYRGVAFVWIKTKADGQPIGAQGVRPSIVKPLTEFVLAASRQERGRPMPLASESVVQTVFAPRQEHSRKPDEVQRRIEMLYPNATKLELFARRKRKGWVCKGDELDGAER